MLDLSLTYQGKKVTITISKDADVTIHGTMSPSDPKEVTAVIRGMCEKYRKVNIFTQDFDEVVKDVKRVEKLKDAMVSLRTVNMGGTRVSSYSRRSRRSSVSSYEKEKSEIHEFVNGVFYEFSRYEYKEKKGKFNTAQKLVLHHISNDKLGADLSKDDYTDLYLPVSKNRDKVIALHEELMAFPFKKYVDSTKHTEIVNKITAQRDIALNQINAYETLVNEAGKDIVNWSGPKISRRLNLMEGVTSNYEISRWITSLVDSLLKKGVEKEAPKAKREPTHVKLLSKWENGEELTQGEVVTLFKQTTHTEEMISLMTLETIYSIMESDLKIVREKLGRIYNDGSLSLNMQGRLLIERACDLAPNNKEEFNRIKTYADKVKFQLPWSYLFRSLNFITSDYVVELINDRHVIREPIPAEFYDKHLAKLKPQVLLDLCNQVTKEFVSRLSEKEKIGVLPRLGNEFIKDDIENSMKFIMEQDWWDEIKRVDFDAQSDLFELYKDVPWEAIKPIIMRLDSLRKHSIELAFLNKDVEVFQNILEESGGQISLENRVRLLEMFDERTRTKMILKSIENGEDIYKDSFKKVLTAPYIISMFKALIGKKDYGFIDRILEYGKHIGINQQVFRDIITSRNDLGYVRLTSTFIKLLDKKTKKHLLAKTYLEAAKESTYGQRVEGFVPLYQEFFQDLKREDLPQDLRENLVKSSYRLYLAHVMTQDELGQASVFDIKFLRLHVDKIPLSYLLKYEDKELFKKVVQDRRDRSNNAFAYSLEKRLEEKLKASIKPANSVKFMFA